MEHIYPPEIEELVKQELRTGEYADEAALLTNALEVYRELTLRHEELRTKIQNSINQEKQGLIAPLDIDELLNELDEALA